ncbi:MULTISPECIES: hypothetical protein [Azospirillum]|jgi:hypothetical protein|uniref:Uncharacterized protein n=1 Tax=Azospirillum brasilense TaxID=192 RepID=A0ABU4P4C2_AZOBR|nr:MULTISPECIES: hypothetical protein [Azospirillum]MDW7557519.1 hypothetical protein [Azospirillum brasilense]MDW7597068.1 hypothetical protein [Azospirillum brasilense]MDW7632203.1 hypothetical protein [Azospirillum brasilense]MDX5952415.1 hypothetical protein [Azospirillum brasilense]
MANNISEYVAQVVDLPEQDVFRMIGDVSQRSVNATGVAGELSIEPPPQSMGIDDELEELGKRICNRWNRELFALVCGSREEDQKDRALILSQFGIDRDVAVAAIATLLVSSFGVIPAVATLVATMFLKRLANPTKEEVCKFWSERLPKE